MNSKVYGVLKDFLKIYLFYVFIFGCVGSLLLCGSPCCERRLLFIVVCGLLIAVAPLVVEHGL